MNIPKVSIIVPVYNAGEYLRKRLDTLIGQTLKEIEIILVLDCPTDGSDKIAEAYAAKDKRIVLIHNKTNLHVGLSRNEGLKVARGEYIGFSDHDDFSTADMFGKMYQKGSQTNADIVLSDFYLINSSGTHYMGFPLHYSNEEFIQKSIKEFIRYYPPLKNQRSFRSHGLIWNQIYKKDFLDKYRICFQDNRFTTHEDRTFLMECYLHIRNISILPEAFYYHIWHPGSAGTAYSYRAVTPKIAYLVHMHNLLVENQKLPQEYAAYSTSVLFQLYSAFRHELRHLSLPGSLKKITEIRKNTTLQQALRKLFKKGNRHLLLTFPPTKLCFLLLITRIFPVSGQT